jgi:EthD domain
VPDANLPGFAPPPGPIKLVILPRTRANLDRAGLRRHLETVHGPLVVSHPAVSSGFRSYVHHYTQDCPVVHELEGRDAVTVIRFAGFADMAASKANSAYRDSVGPDEDNFRELAGSLALFADEREVSPAADDATKKLFVFRRAADVDLDHWASRLAAIAARRDVQGVVTNLSQVLEGECLYNQFDEIGLAESADLPAITSMIAELAKKSLAPVETRYLLTEPVRFI